MIDNSEAIKNFYDLYLWKQAHLFVVKIYKITKNFPKEEVYGIVSQLRRAAVSLTSNIAEGFSRRGYNEKLQFYHFAKGSLTEIQNQLFICRDVGYISDQEFTELFKESVIILKLLNAFINKCSIYFKKP